MRLATAGTVPNLAVRETKALQPEKTLAQQTSVIIVAYNSGHFLDECIASIRRTEPEVEIVVVDSASTDGAVDRVAADFSSVRVVRSKKNLGFGEGSNLGAERARGKYLAFLNPDTVVAPGWLNPLVGALRDRPATGLTTSKVLQMDEPDIVSACGLELHCSGLALARGHGRHRDAFVDSEKVAAISGAAFAIRKDVFLALGGFDGDFFLYMEDIDISLRARVAGYSLLCVPSSVVYHDYTLHFGPRKTFYQERNRYLVLLKSLRWRSLLVLLPALLLSEVVTWGFVFFREKKNLSNKLEAYRWITAHWPAIMEKRMRVQALRRVRDRDLIAQSASRIPYEQTGTGPLAWMARLVFDPLFWVLQNLALLLMWW